MQIKTIKGIYQKHRRVLFMIVLVGFIAGLVVKERLGIREFLEMGYMQVEIIKELA